MRWPAQSMFRVVLESLGRFSHCANAASEVQAPRGPGWVADAQWKVESCCERCTVLEERVLEG